MGTDLGMRAGSRNHCQAKSTIITAAPSSLSLSHIESMGGLRRDAHGNWPAWWARQSDANPSPLGVNLSTG
jgi:hypothetical protein